MKDFVNLHNMENDKKMFTDVGNLQPQNIIIIIYATRIHDHVIY